MKVERLIKKFALKVDLTEQNKGLAKVTTDVLNDDANRSTDVNKSKEQVARIVNENPTVAAVLPRIYIQIQNESQRASAKKLAETLKAHQYIVFGVETRPENISATSVRYFYETDKPAAESLVNLLKEQGIHAVATYTQGYQDRVKSGQFEIWLSATSLKE